MSVDCGDGEPAEVDQERRIRARKEHKCDACRGTIERGHIYARHTLIYAGQVDVTVRCLRCDEIYQHLCAIHREANERARQERLASRRPGYFSQKLTAEQNRWLNHESDWPAVALNCGHEFKERWGHEPPPELARLAFMTPAELQAEALAKVATTSSEQHRGVTSE